MREGKYLRDTQYEVEISWYSNVMYLGKAKQGKVR